MVVDNTKKQNILIVHNYYQIPGGEDTVVASEKKLLEEHGHKVILYSRNNKRQVHRADKRFSLTDRSCHDLTVTCSRL